MTTPPTPRTPRPARPSSNDDARANPAAARGGSSISVMTVLLALVLGLPGVSLLATIGGCGRESADPRPAVARVDTYSGTRGRIVQVPEAGTPDSSLRIHHEEVANFRNAAGDEVGMRHMAMSFEIAQGVSLPELEIGTAVQFDWQVTYLEDGRPEGPGRITAMTVLPQDTRLQFEAADDAAADNAAADNG